MKTRETKIKHDLELNARVTVILHTPAERLPTTKPRPCHRKHKRAETRDRVSFEVTARNLPSVLFYRLPAQENACFYF